MSSPPRPARPQIVLRFDRDPSTSWYQEIAGEPVVADRPLVAGATPRIVEAAEAAAVPESGFEARGAALLFDGEAPDGGEPRRVVAEVDRRGWRSIRYADGERFLVSPGGELVLRDRAGEASEPLTLERALGAPLALALAARSVHLLHASAIDFGEGAVALTAASGAGKSTLAAAAGEAGAERLADDILPVRLAADSRALPRFPQLKLPPAEQMPAGLPTERPLRALVELDRRPGGSPIRLERREGSAALLPLAGATVAARLFDPGLLAAHLDACAAAAARLAVLRLTYPSGRERLPEVLGRLRAELG